MLSSTAASGANSSVSSSWNDDASRHDRSLAVERPGGERADRGADVARDRHRQPASRWMWPISSTVVVLPFVPVTATNSLGSSRHASSSSPSTGSPRSRAAAITGA